MKQRDIKHIIELIFKQLYKIRGHGQNGFEAADLHKCRVEIKKLRALLRLIRFSKISNPKSLLPHGLKKIYRFAGKARDLQLQLERIRNYDRQGIKCPGYRNILERECENCIKQLQQKFQIGLLHDALRICIEHAPKQIRAAEIRKFFLQKRSTIIALRAAKYITEDGFHTIRKNIKDMVYILGMLNAARPKTAGIKLSSAESLAKKLGELNDIRNALYYLRPHYLQLASPEEGSFLQSLRSQWLAEKRSMKENLYLELKNADLTIWLPSLDNRDSG